MEHKEDISKKKYIYLKKILLKCELCSPNLLMKAIP